MVLGVRVDRQGADAVPRRHDVLPPDLIHIYIYIYIYTHISYIKV